MMFSELCEKEVINIKDCRKLGHIIDMEFDEHSGCICKVTIGETSRFPCFFKQPPECVICFKDICQIGPDIILVNLCI